MTYSVQILRKQWLSGNYIRLVVEKPYQYKYTIGQAIELTINKGEYRNKLAPFTITSLPENSFLEFIVKVYPSHKGLTLALSNCLDNETLLITDAWDSYHYEGKGTFIAGGSGITPFVPMIRNLKRKGNLSQHLLILANKTSNDIILKWELKNLLRDHFINVLSKEANTFFEYGRIDSEFLKKTIHNYDQKFYLCGPPNFSEDIRNNLLHLGAQSKDIQIGY